MFNERRLLAGGLVSALAVVWIFVALGTPDGLADLVRFLGPAMLLAVAVAWLFFTFAGNLFTWSRAIRSVIVGAAVLTPVLAYFFSASKDQNLMTKFLFMVAVGWAASLGGTLWSLAGAASDAFREWRDDRRTNRRRRLYVPAWATAIPDEIDFGCAEKYASSYSENDNDTYTPRLLVLRQLPDTLRKL